MALSSGDAARWFSRVVWLGIAANLGLALPTLLMPARMLAFSELPVPEPLLWTQFAALLLVLLSAAPLAIGANLLRVLGLVLLVVWKGPAILDTFLHPLSGMLTFALALPVIFWLGAESKGAGRS